MVHLSSFSAVRYRGIDGVSLCNLKDINLITGANGTGKTSLIEAMWLFTGRYNPHLLWNANVQRLRSTAMNPISRLTDGELELHGVEGTQCHRLRHTFERINGTYPAKTGCGDVQIDVKTMPPVAGLIRTYLDDKPMGESAPVIHMTPHGSVLLPPGENPAGRSSCIIESAGFQHETTAEYLQRYSDLVRDGQKKELVRAIGMVADHASDIEMLADENGNSYLAVATGTGRPRPLHDLGGGAVKLVRMILSFSAARNGMLLFDELENGIHHTLHRQLWKKAQAWANQWKVQFVATTHNAEMIDAAIDVFGNSPEALAIHKLIHDKQSGRTNVATYTGEALSGIQNLNLEVR